MKLIIKTNSETIIAYKSHLVFNKSCFESNEKLLN